MPAAQTAIRWVAHPLTVAAAFLLLLNDHVLKTAFPGPVTGKLSDVAGLVAAPALLALAVGLIAPKAPPSWPAAIALVATGAGFTWTKASQAGAEAASAAWSVVNGPSVILADPTDLLALPALGLAWWAWRRSRSGPPLAARAVPRARLFVALPLVVLATAGTSAAPDPEAVFAVEEYGGRVALYTNYGVTHGLPSAGDWSPLEEFRPEGAGPGYQQENEKYEALRAASACVPGEPAHCYRLHEGAALGVDETADGGATWRTAWEIPPERWKWLVGRHDLPEYQADLLGGFDILVRAVPGGHEVVVAAGVEGLVVRSPAGGWNRVAVEALGPVGYGPARFAAGPVPLADFGYGVLKELGLALLLGAFLVFAGTLVTVSSRRGDTIAWSVVSGGLLGFSVPVLGLMSFTGSAAWLAILAVVLLLAHTVFVLRGRALGRLRGLVFLAAAVLPAAAYAAPYLGWTVAFPASYDTASRVAVLAAVAALVPTVLVFIRLARAAGRERHRPGQW